MHISFMMVSCVKPTLDCMPAAHSACQAAMRALC